MLNFHVENLDSSSLMREAEGEQVDGEAHEVRTVRLDELAPTRKLPRPYLIKADVQGAELQVLDGASQMLGETKLVILETSLFGFFLGGPQVYEVCRYMKERGFVAYDLFGPFSRPLDWSLGQIDIAFVKENGFFRQSHWCATPEQRSTTLRHNDIPEVLAALRSRTEMKR